MPKFPATPPKWRATVDKRLPDAVKFWTEAAAFEAIPRGDAVRELGFYQYAPLLLVAKNKKGGGTEPVFPAVWNYASHKVRAELIALARKKCVYCEGAPTDSEKQVDHFRPKKLFPTLAYDVWNLFLACRNCNGVKLDNWPIACGYVRPDDGDPSKRFAFAEDGGMTAVPGDGEADATVRDFKLDRPEYQERRRELAIEPRLKMVRAIIASAVMTDALKLDLVRLQLAEPNLIYSEAINQCVRRVWSAAFPGVALG